MRLCTAVVFSLACASVSVYVYEPLLSFLLACLLRLWCIAIANTLDDYEHVVVVATVVVVGLLLLIAIVALLQ